MLIALSRADTEVELEEARERNGRQLTGFGSELGILESTWKKPGDGPERRLERGDC